MIGLIQVDGKYPNLALMKLSAWLKKQDCEITTLPMQQDQCEKVYAAKVFNYSEDGFVIPTAIKGGTGYEWEDGEYSHNLPDLPDEIEHIYPDYENYNCDYAMGYLTRGCIRKCKFCVVPQQMGKPKHNAHLSEWWGGQKLIRLLDPNITAHPDCIDYLRELEASKAEVDFSQGLDARLLTEEMVIALRRVKVHSQIHTAWDNVAEEASVLRGINLLHKYKLHPMVYVLIGSYPGGGSTPEEDYYRVMKLREIKDTDPFVMPYDKDDEYQNRFARWVNMKATFKSCEWEEYR